MKHLQFLADVQINLLSIYITGKIYERRRLWLPFPFQSLFELIHLSVSSPPGIGGDLCVSLAEIWYPTHTTRDMRDSKLLSNTWIKTWILL